MAEWQILYLHDRAFIDPKTDQAPIHQSRTMGSETRVNAAQALRAASCSMRHEPRVSSHTTDLA